VFKVLESIDEWGNSVRNIVMLWFLYKLFVIVMGLNISPQIKYMLRISQMIRLCTRI